MKKIVCLFLLALSILSIQAQIDVPAPSPSSTLIQKFGLAEIKIDYSRPGINNRKIFGNIVPFDSIWRTGANSPTTFITNDSLTINGQGLAKGSYVILTRPGKTNWDIIFNKNPLVSYTNYIPKDDVLRINVPVNKTSQTVQSFTISIADIKTDNCNLNFEWENTAVQLHLVNDVHTKVMNQIKQKLSGPTQTEYTAMARFYYENGENVNDALIYINKAVEMGEGYGNLRLKSLILAKSGDKKQAIAVAKKSLERAITFNNQDYIRMNKDSIAEWEK